MPSFLLSWSRSVTMPDITSRSFNASTLPNVTDAGDQTLQVICAWPVSGQYGPGTRVLYYILIAACLLARKADWIKNAALAAALILPVVAAVHGIVLAILHTDNAVDMDIYGAFQLCSIGILAGPVTVRLSRTYFNDPGRNTIFLWAGLILAGLMSLAVEFYRISTTACAVQLNGELITDSSHFPYGNPPKCPPLDCSKEYSPMRSGASNSINLIPEPETIKFGTATLLAAGCCVHAIVWMLSMLVKIVENSTKSHVFGIGGRTEEGLHDPIEGTNGATRAGMIGVNNVVRFYLSIAVIPIFGGAGLALLIMGEINFFSKQVKYDTESLASVGQWAPIVGTGLATFGSLYLLLVADVEAVKAHRPMTSQSHCNCSHHSQHQEVDNADITSIRASHYDDEELAHVHTVQSHATSNHREKVAQGFIKVGKMLGHAAQQWLDDREFRQGPAAEFPVIPGEENRNEKLERIKESYNPPPSPRAHDSRTSADGSTGSIYETRSLNTTYYSPSPHVSDHLPQAPHPARAHLKTTSVDEGRDRARRDTLQVPAQAHQGYNQLKRSKSASM